MSNNLKNKLKQRFDKDTNYNQIISKVERKNNIWFKYSLIPVCLAVIVGVVIFGDNNTKTYTPDNKNNNTIVINERTDKGSSRLIMASVQDWKISEEFLFVNNLAVPNDLLLSDKYLLYFPILPEGYKPKDGWITEWQSDPFSSPFTELRDYVIFFTDDVEGTEIYYKSIKIAFSEKGTPARCYFFMDDTLIPSKINDIEVNIIKYEDYYHTTFKYNNLYFDVETKGITETELIKLIESIIK